MCFCLNSPVLKLFLNMKESELATPYFIVYEDKLRRNIELIMDVARRSGAEIIMAFKANALWRTFDIFREYGVKFTASSLNELQLGKSISDKRPTAIARPTLRLQYQNISAAHPI